MEDHFTSETEPPIAISDEERAHYSHVLEQIVKNRTDQGISMISLRNAKITRQVLVQMAHEENPHANLVLNELNLRSILEEAKNPDTREEVAQELLCKLVLCEISSIRRRAIQLLLKSDQDRLVELMNEVSVNGTLRREILQDILQDDNVPLRIMLKMLRSEQVPTDVKEQVEGRILRIRRIVEENSAQIIDWNHRLEDLDKRKRLKFKDIAKYYQEVKESLDEFKTIPSSVMDLKLDVELAYESLKKTIK